MKLVNRNRRKCTACGWRGQEGEVLAAPDPFDPKNYIYACPRCKTIHAIVEVCPFAGCHKTANCGTPYQKDYVRCCGDHYRQIKEADL